jgi:hypothetical protein
MSSFDLIDPNLLGLGIILLFVLLMGLFTLIYRKQLDQKFRDIPAYTRLSQAISLAVESGRRVHLSLGTGGIDGIKGASGLSGLTILKLIARKTSLSDRPVIATSGESTLAILSQDTLKSSGKSINVEEQYDPSSGQITGLSPTSYTVGTLPIIFDPDVSANVFVGSFGSEVSLLTDASERTGTLSVAGSENIAAQAVMYATAQEPLVGEEVYAGGAYLNGGRIHIASIRAQDFLRWVLILTILIGAVLKVMGIL